MLFLFFLAYGTGGKFKSSASLVFERLAGSKRFVAPVDMLQLHTGHVHVSPERVKDEFFSRVDLSGKEEMRSFLLFLTVFFFFVRRRCLVQGGVLVPVLVGGGKRRRSRGDSFVNRREIQLDSHVGHGQAG